MLGVLCLSRGKTVRPAADRGPAADHERGAKVAASSTPASVRSRSPPPAPPPPLPLAPLVLARVTQPSPEVCLPLGHTTTLWAHKAGAPPAAPPPSGSAPPAAPPARSTGARGARVTRVYKPTEDRTTALIYRSTVHELVEV